MNTIDLECQSCGKTFTVLAKLKSQKTCGFSCRNKLRAKGNKDNVYETKQCAVCGNDFVGTIRKKRKVCSLNCAGSLSANNRPKVKREERPCQYCGKLFVSNYDKPSRRQKYCNKTCQGKACGPLNGKGGYREGSGRGKAGWYKGYWCDSSWELAFLIHCLDSGKVIERNTQMYDYEYGGKIKRYIPDFRVDGCLTEIKGYHTPVVDAKIACCPEQIVLLGKEEMEPILGNIRKTYGNDFIRLYESKDQ